MAMRTASESISNFSSGFSGLILEKTTEIDAAVQRKKSAWKDEKEEGVLQEYPRLRSGIEATADKVDRVATVAAPVAKAIGFHAAVKVRIGATLVKGVSMGAFKIGQGAVEMGKAGVDRVQQIPIVKAKLEERAAQQKPEEDAEPSTWGEFKNLMTTIGSSVSHVASTTNHCREIVTDSISTSTSQCITHSLGPEVSQLTSASVNLGKGGAQVGMAILGAAGSETTTTVLKEHGKMIFEGGTEAYEKIEEKLKIYAEYPEEEILEAEAKVRSEIFQEKYLPKYFKLNSKILIVYDEKPKRFHADEISRKIPLLKIREVVFQEDHALRLKFQVENEIDFVFHVENSAKWKDELENSIFKLKDWLANRGVQEFKTEESMRPVQTAEPLSSDTESQCEPLTATIQSPSNHDTMAAPWGSQFLVSSPTPIPDEEIVVSI
eukprot:TRINITY_DN2432_c0_g1_i1.p1 TRINITY_DN2432_c0_g1~~TRINITY_DN2432_c0_g1_i1.p1  ORF type:complete len:435 (+),score=132.43 TRINITY_DN2432_c0_g1_i1:285-1589(+)